MKRPPSVVTAIVVLSLFALAVLYFIYATYSTAAYVQMAVYVLFLFVVLAPIYGLSAQKSWSRLYSAILFGALAALLLIGNGSIAIKQQVVVALMYALVLAGLLVWLIVSLMSQEVKGYFLPPQQGRS